LPGHCRPGRQRSRPSARSRDRAAPIRRPPDQPGSAGAAGGPDRPTSGVVELPITIDWGPRRRYDLDTDADRRIVYERVLREAGDAEEVGLTSTVQSWSTCGRACGFRGESARPGNSASQS
jgi:hypothetical protein